MTSINVTTGYSCNPTMTTTKVSDNQVIAYRSVATSTDGKYVVVVATNDYIYTTSDYAQTWTQRNTSVGTKQYNGVCSSATGQYLVAGTSGEYVYTSSDYGVTWIQRTAQGTKNWVFFASSSSGKNVIGTASNVAYISSDYGQTWTTSYTHSASYFLQGCACSADFKTLGVCTQIDGGNAGQVYLSWNGGVGWYMVQSSSIFGFVSMAISSTGKYILTAFWGDGGLYLSTDKGMTSKLVNATSGYWSTVDISPSGKYMVASVMGGPAYLSRNGGSSWTALSTPSGYLLSTWTWICAKMSESGLYVYMTIKNVGIYRVKLDNVDIGDLVGIPTLNGGYMDLGYKTSNGSMPTAVALTASLARTWVSMAGSSDGKYLVALSYGSGIYVSSDWGDSWTQSNQTAGNWNNVAVSGDGKRALASKGIQLYWSSDWGSTWTTMSITVTYGTTISKVAMSTTGDRLYASVYGFGLFWCNTKDSYAWTQFPTLSGKWGSLDCSADGQYVYAATNSGDGLYVSSNYGGNFTMTSAPMLKWNGMCVCRNGQMAYAVDNPLTNQGNGNVYKTSDFGSTWQKLDSLSSVNTYVLSCSETGRYAAVSGNSTLYVTKDGGTTWAAMGNSIGFSWIPRMGQYVFGMVESDKIYRLDTGANLGDMVGCPSGNYTTKYRWLGSNTLTTVLHMVVLWKSIAASVNGKYVLSCGEVTGGKMLIVSNTYGVSWNLVNVSLCNHVAVSKDGRIMAAAADDGLYHSGDYGVSWTTFDAFNYLNDWTGLKLSSDGQFMVSSTNSGIVRVYYGLNYGQSLPISGSLGLGGLAISSDTTYTYIYENFAIFRSTNFGGFVKIYNRTKVKCISTNATGQYVVAVCSNTSGGSGIYMSYDFGSAWSLVFDYAANWQSCAISPSGRVIVASINNDVTGGIYSSTDYGRTWTATGAPANSYMGLSLCGFGHTLYANGSSGSVYKMTLTIDVGDMLAIESSL